MSFEGTVINGNVILDEQGKIPEGSRVGVVIKSPTKAVSPLGEMLLRHAGKAVGLPEDMAAQHDHYLHGTPKK